MNSLFLPWLDLLALLWFASGWALYVWHTDHRATTRPTLRRQMDNIFVNGSRKW